MKKVLLFLGIILLIAAASCSRDITMDEAAMTRPDQTEEMTRAQAWPSDPICLPESCPTCSAQGSWVLIENGIVIKYECSQCWHVITFFEQKGEKPIGPGEPDPSGGN